MSSTLSTSYRGAGGSRRMHYSRPPSDDMPPPKRSKPLDPIDFYDRAYFSGSDKPRTYTSICVKNINPKLSDLGD
jgi:hypothetical protein